MNLLGIGREGPGERVLTVMPSGPTSRVSARVKLTMPPLEATIVKQERYPAEKGDRGDVDDPAPTGRLERGIGSAGAQVVALQVPVQDAPYGCG